MLPFTWVYIASLVVGTLIEIIAKFRGWEYFVRRIKERLRW